MQTEKDDMPLQKIPSYYENIEEYPLNEKPKTPYDFSSKINQVSFFWNGNDWRFFLKQQQTLDSPVDFSPMPLKKDGIIFICFKI